MENNKVIFISDVHLGMNKSAEELEREKMLITFLRNTLAPNDRLFIVGDMFDFWFEYKTVIPKDHIQVLACLKELIENNIAIDYVAGNHDFWVGEFFKKELGLTFHPEPVKQTIGDKVFYVIHGDGLKKKDSAYRLLKKVFRNKLNIFLYRWLHPDIGVPFAKWCSHSSRNHTSQKDFGGDEEYTDFAKTKFEEGVDYVIMAHTHNPLSYNADNGKMLVNTGDWINHFTYAKFEKGKLSLETYQHPSD